MWCIVNLPNGTQQACQLDPKAIGQECLEKVCKALGIICEMEYFGLEHWSGVSHKESRTHSWINLRNRLSCDSSSGCGGIQLMLALRVKFWVPVHFILQESARNLFYMQAKVDLLEGRLNANNWTNAAKLAALLCQADGLRFNEASLKTDCPLKIRRDQQTRRRLELEQQQQLQHQNSAKERKDREHVLSFKKRRLSKQKSVENIDSVPVCSQLSSSVASSSISVNAPTTSTSTTFQRERKPSSTNSDTSTTKDQEHSPCCQTDETIEKLISTSPLRIYQDYIIRPVQEETELASSEELPEDFLRQIAIEHGKLACLKMSAKSAKYWLLKEIQDLPGYGEEVFNGVTGSENSQRCDIAVGAHGIAVTIGGDNKYNIPFSAIAAAKSFRRNFKLEYVDDANTRREVDIKLPKHAIASGLYRSITERHAFYVCDKVRGVVTNQFTRDLKGTIASMFKEDTELGKRYVFDIQHTSREVHDQARRILHERGVETSSASSVAGDDITQSATDNLATCSMTTSNKLDSVLREKEEREAAIERCVDSRITEAMTCKICMDRSINTMFNPCCHILACDQCASRCDKCPNCRVKVTNVVKIYLPPELRTSPASPQCNSSYSSKIPVTKSATAVA